MKTLLIFSFVLIALPLTCRTQQIDTNLLSTVLSKARFRDEDRARLTLQQALQKAVLVTEATVIDSNTSVKVSTNQNELSPGQGFTAVSLRVTHVFKGDPQPGLILVDNAFHRDSHGVFCHPIEATNGQDCILILLRAEGLSRVCQTNVYAVIRDMEVK
jgi:hypothetical protein